MRSSPGEGLRGSARSGRRATGTSPAPGKLVGRDVETEILADFIHRIEDEGNAVLVRGDPGIGKSRLLRAAADLAASAGWTVLDVRGIDTGTMVPFSGLHLLLRPLLAQTNSIPPVQRRAILTAFGLADGPPPELFLVALATLTTLTEKAGTRPIVLLVDDMQWLDGSTNEVLAFVGRRIAHDPIVIIGAARTGCPIAFSAADPYDIELYGLDDNSSRELLTASTDADFRDFDMVLQAAVGNPLALMELPAVWGSTSESELYSLPVSVPLSARLERAFASRITGLPPLTRDAILVAAVSRDEELAEILAGTSVLSGRPVTAVVLEAAEQAGILRFDELHVRFRHPLVRSGVLLHELADRRREANGALSEALRHQPYRRSWYLAQAVEGPDDDVADDLERGHQESIRRGSVLAAIAGLERAAQLTTDSSLRGKRLLVAAQHAFGLGRADLVDHLVTAAERNELSELDRARALWLRQIFDDGAPGDTDRIDQLCAIAVRAHAAGDPDLALNLLLSAALRCWWTDPGGQTRARVVRAARALDGVRQDPRCLAAIAVAEPILRGSQIIAELSNFTAETVADADHLRLLGMAARAVGAEVHAADFLDRAESTLRSQGRLGLLSQVLALQGAVRIDLGDWRRAAESTEEARRLAKDTGQPVWTTGAAVLEARAAALRGDSEGALRRAADVEGSPTARGINDFLACAQLARGIAYVAAGRHADAFEALTPLFLQGDHRHHQREQLSAVMFLAEAAVHCGRHQEAREILGRMEALATVTASPVLHTHLLYARPVLADDAVAEKLYLDALSQDLTRWPWPRARIQLAYGSWLRRQRRASESREPLRLALATFDLIGATTWAALTQAELRAAGERTDLPHAVSPAAVLSAQELQVARLAAAGLSNRAIAERMFLSPRTVASHLYRIFPKLGIRSRAQLPTMLNSPLPPGPNRSSLGKGQSDD